MNLMTLPHTNSNDSQPIAYFCAEFALTQSLPIYSGGLGVLAGDTIRQASDSKLPFIGIGLYYRQGYFTQKIKQGKQISVRTDIKPEPGQLKLVTNAANAPLLIQIPHHQGLITAQVWLYKHQNVSIYLLDTNIDAKSPHREVTKSLYDPNPEIRIRQEMVLGIGGAKLLKALNIHPRMYHLNEGHSAFAGFELTAELMHDHAHTFEQAQQLVKKSIVFTNHTIVPAGNDIFSKHQLSQELREYATSENLPMQSLLDSGTDPDDSDLFSMTILALNYSVKANTVSKLHHQIARTVWPEYHFHAITNGVHLPTWIAPNIQQAVPSLNRLGLHRLDESNLWHLHAQNKQALVQLVKAITGNQLNPDVLTVVWARRFAGYKRANLVLQHTSELKQLIRDGKIQIIFAGKAHPNDEIGQGIIESIHRNINITGTHSGISFIPNYNLDIAKVLVAGSDIWLNTPIRGQEASGTSGMKAGANGVLQFSVSDGWMDEVTWDNIGWILPETHTDSAIYRMLQTQILPCYESRNAQGIPEEWTSRMSQTMQIIWERFSALRMLNDYREVLYTSAGPS